MEWMVCVTGDDFDLQELSKSLNSPELCVIKEENECYLKSTSFKQLSSDNKVQNKAKNILSLFNGVLRLALGTREPITIAKVIKIKDDGNRETYVYGSLRIPVKSRASIKSVTIVSSNGTVQEIQQPDPILSWIKIAQGNENVAKVFRLLANFGYDWVNLNRILEVIMKDVGGSSNITRKGWATKKSIDRFTGTANNPDVIGDTARHGIAKNKPLEDPMTFSEAKSLIETVLHNWLRSKI